MGDTSLFNRLLDDIEEETPTVDPWETSSFRSTVRGIGSASGRAIMMVGIGILTGVNYMTERVALTWIEASQTRSTSYSPLSSDAYKTILEYQRYVIVTQYFVLPNY